MTITLQSKFLTLDEAKIHYLEGGEATQPCILFLHGASFNAQTWADLGTMLYLVNHNYRVIALDLPGFGQSSTSQISPHYFLLRTLNSLKLNKPVLVSPSMSGQYSLPLVAHYPDKLSGFVALAPVGIPQLQEQLKRNPLPTLAIWGSNDLIVPVEHATLLVESMAQAQKVILLNAGHASYLRETEAFHQHLLDFVKTYLPGFAESNLQN